MKTGTSVDDELERQDRLDSPKSFWTAILLTVLGFGDDL